MTMNIKACAVRPLSDYHGCTLPASHGGKHLCRHGFEWLVESERAEHDAALVAEGIQRIREEERNG